MNVLLPAVMPANFFSHVAARLAQAQYILVLCLIIKLLHFMIDLSAPSFSSVSFRGHGAPLQQTINMRYSILDVDVQTHDCTHIQSALSTVFSYIYRALETHNMCTIISVLSLGTGYAIHIDTHTSPLSDSR